MTHRQARIAVIVVGVLLPYAARLPGGVEWLAQYNTGLVGFLLFSGLNAIAWGSILAVAGRYRHPLSVLAPAVPGFAFLAWCHNRLDLASDPNAAIALAIIPVQALVPIAMGGAVGFLMDRHVGRTAQAAALSGQNAAGAPAAQCGRRTLAWPFAAGFGLLLAGFLWGVLFASVPYPDPTAEQAMSFALHSTISSVLLVAGIVVIALVAVIALAQRITRR